MTATGNDRRMGDVEHLMWRLEDDRLLSSTFANVSILDRAPDVDRLRRRMERAAAAIPRLRRIAQPLPGSLGPPSWVDDPEFAIDTHVRHLALPPPGTDRQLFDLAGHVVADPFDRHRPLWQFTVVEGLADGRAALIEKLHHTVSDGEGGVRLAMEFLDLERDPAEPAGIDDTNGEPDDDVEEVEEHRSAIVVRETLAGALRLPLGVARRVRELLDEPDRIPDASAAAADTARSVAAQLAATDPARSPLWTGRSGRSRLDVASAPLEALRSAAARHEGSLNDAFVTIAADAAGRYHDELGDPVDELRASVAVSTRTDDSGANAFSLVRLLVPTGELEVSERFTAVRQAIRDALDAEAAPLDSLAALASVLPTPVVTRLVRQHAGTVDLATSNVRGIPVPVYVAGAKLLHNYPVGPLAGVPCNLTLLSSPDHVDIGINTDSSAIERPELLQACVDDAIGRLIGG